MDPVCAIDIKILIFKIVVVVSFDYRRASTISTH